MERKTLLLATLLIVTAAFAAFWTIRLRRAARGSVAPDIERLAIGFITNFFDTLGIGSFATTTTIYRLRHLIDDANIPGTLNVGHAIPTITQALVFITLVSVDFRTLLVLIAAAVAGSWIGAGIVAGLPRRAIQRGMGVALLVAAALMILTAANLIPVGGEALALSVGKLGLAAGITFVLGALMTLGIGAYAPIMIMVSLLGMNPTAAFPIMMGACAFLMPVASIQFITKTKYDACAALGLAIGGVPGVLIAAFIVRSLPLGYVRWLVVIVALYTAVTLLAASRQRTAPAPSAV